jgi:hypothetical protein
VILTEGGFDIPVADICFTWTVTIQKRITSKNNMPACLEHHPSATHIPAERAFD